MGPKTRKPCVFWANSFGLDALFEHGMCQAVGILLYRLEPHLLQAADATTGRVMLRSGSCLALIREEESFTLLERCNKSSL